MWKWKLKNKFNLTTAVNAKLSVKSQNSYKMGEKKVSESSTFL